MSATEPATEPASEQYDPYEAFGDLAGDVRDPWPDLAAARRQAPVQRNTMFALEGAEVPPDLFTSMFTCARTAGWSAHVLEQKREGRLFIDVNRNAYAQTVVAPYAVRARRRAPVALPIGWADVESDTLRPDSFTIATVWDWLRDHVDPWTSMGESRRPIPRLTEADRPDRSGRRRGVSRKERAQPS